MSDWLILNDRRLGRVGETFPARRKGDDRTYCAKFLRSDRTDIPSEHLHQEAERLKSTAAPDRMPRLIDTGTKDGRDFIVMEWLAPIEYPIADKHYRDFCVDAATGLGEIHRSFLHCDLTPNHLRWKNGKVAFIDFDNAVRLGEAPRNRHCIGTDPFIAPEVASRGEVTVQSDIYSLAYILREHCPAKLLDTFDPVLRAAMDPDPKKRPPSAAIFAEQLKNARPPHHRFKTIAKWIGIVTIIFFLIPALAYCGLQAIFWIDYWVHDDSAAEVQTCNSEMLIQTAKQDWSLKDYTNARKVLTIVSDRHDAYSTLANAMLKEMDGRGL